jgi:hypothetical protein
MYRSHVTPTMTKKSGKRRNPTGITGNYSSPRRGEKSKQMKVTPVKESETKGSRQTKLSFPTAGNDNNSPPTPSGTMALKVITPDDHAGTNHIRHPSPPSNPESPQTTRKHTPQNNTDNTTTKATTTKTSPPENNTVTSNDGNDNKKPAAKTSSTTTRNNEFKEPATTTNREQFTLVKKPPRRKKKSQPN